MTLKPKSLDLRKQINQHQKLKRKYSLKATEKQLEKHKERWRQTNNPSGINILFNLQQKQINDLKEIIFELEERIIKLEGE